MVPLGYPWAFGPPGASRRLPGPKTNQSKKPKNLKELTERWSKLGCIEKTPEILRIRPGIFDFEADLGLKRSQTKPKIPGTVPTNRHTTIPNNSGSTSACFDDPKLLNCEISQPSRI